MSKCESRLIAEMFFARARVSDENAKGPRPFLKARGESYRIKNRNHTKDVMHP